MKYAPAIERLILVIWVGGIWTVGFLVAPTLFGMLENRAVAGNIAGNLFTSISYVSLLCGFMLLTLAFVLQGARYISHWRSWLVLAMLALTAIGQFVVTPRMHELRLARLAEKSFEPQLLEQFQTLHAISSSLFVLTSILGLVLVVVGATQPGADLRR
ncbi:MAG: DUF4149 domain-containing protein [Acidiferrobacterales bacterium]|nr:DUF4149 domain-containing protein [Acidiferrobacterales bacterium]